LIQIPAEFHISNILVQSLTSVNHSPQRSKGMSRDTSVAEAIRDRLDRLTASERRAARALLANYPMLGLETVAAFSARSGVSAPTVLRFTARLGFANYAEFQRRLREEVEAQLKSPLAKAAPGRRAGAGRTRSTFAAAVSANIAETFRLMPAAEFDAAVALIADRKRALHLLGGRFTDSIARYMAAHLRILRPGVSHIAGQPDNWRDMLVDFGRKDVLVVFDVRRYQDDLVAFAEAAATRHATVVLLTDQWLSPIARIALHVLPARIEAPSAWDSNAALLAVAEALVAAVTARTWPASQQRIKALERLRRAEEGKLAGA
jgi:DNA-binding MurR/RpiR family transcriptional regulator